MKTNLTKIAAVAAVFAMSFYANAQDVQMVTLQHGDQMSAYYGANAFYDAMANAQQGDLISLSAGNFGGANIKSAVTIQGAGYIQDPENGRYRTVITGNINISVPEDQSGLCIEGLYCDNNLYFTTNAKNFEIKKSYINYIYLYNDNIVLNNGQFNQNYIRSLSLRGSKNILVNKCVVWDLSSNNESTISIKNCYIHNGSGCYGTYENNIIYYHNSNSAYYNNVHYNSIGSAVASNNYHLGLDSNFFNIFTDSNKADEFSIDYDYRLTSSAAAQYLGTDNTQVGLYGTDKPFTNVPTNPQITSKEVAKETDANGKLLVKFTVEAQQ